MIEEELSPRFSQVAEKYKREETTSTEVAASMNRTMALHMAKDRLEKRLAN